MKKIYTFRKIRKEEISQMFRLVIQRMKWMDENGIKQWNVTKYDKAYPQSYYYKASEHGEVFVLENEETGKIVCAAILKEHDEHWYDNKSAIYLHNFVSKIGEKGVGKIFLKYAEAYAVNKGKKYFRLDSTSDNSALTQYYESKVFLQISKCEEGLYKGILRQKSLL